MLQTNDAGTIWIAKNQIYGHHFSGGETQQVCLL